MGRFRVFSNNQNTNTSSEYNKKKEGIAILKDLRSKNVVNDVEDFSINFCDGTISHYKSYDTYINIVKTYYDLIPKCPDETPNYLDFPSKVMADQIDIYLHLHETISNDFFCKIYFLVLFWLHHF